MYVYGLAMRCHFSLAPVDSNLVLIHQKEIIFSYSMPYRGIHYFILWLVMLSSDLLSRRDLITGV